MARWEQYGHYPKDGVKWLKPAHNPTGKLVDELNAWLKVNGICILCKTKKDI
jgi:hypothetical protein